MDPAEDLVQKQRAHIDAHRAEVARLANEAEAEKPAQTEGLVTDEQREAPTT